MVKATVACLHRVFLDAGLWSGRLEGLAGLAGWRAGGQGLRGLLESWNGEGPELEGMEGGRVRGAGGLAPALGGLFCGKDRFRSTRYVAK